MKLEGKVAIVTGGAEGIGRGIVHCLAEEGADVVIADIKADIAREAAKEVEALGRKALVAMADLTDSNQVTHVVQSTIDAFGRIDILVNNVGGGSRELLARLGRGAMGFVEQKDAEWDTDYAFNFKTHIMMSRSVVPFLIKQKSGRIINISSIDGKVPNPGWMAYSAFKAGLINLTRALSMQLGEHNINVNCVLPGGVRTPNTERLRAAFASLRPSGATAPPAPSPLRGEITPEDIGRAVVFFASEDARMITGQALNVDGGRVPC